MISPEKKAFIEFMMDADVLRFGQFTTKSGRLSPYFVNTGNYRTGAQINALGGFYAALVKETCGGDFDAMFGPAYKGIDRPYFFNRKEAKDHGEGGSLVGYKPQDGDRVIIIEDVITAGTAVRESMPILQSAAAVTVKDMFISVDRCEVGTTPGKTAVMEVKEQFGIDVHAIVTAKDIHDYLAQSDQFSDVLPLMEQYMEQYCVF